MDGDNDDDFFFIFITIFVYHLDSQENIGDVVILREAFKRLPRLLLKIPRYYCPVEMYHLQYFVIFFKRYDCDLKLVAKNAKQGK